MKPVTGNFTGYRLTGNRLTTLLGRKQASKTCKTWNVATRNDNIFQAQKYWTNTCPVRPLFFKWTLNKSPKYWTVQFNISQVAILNATIIIKAITTKQNNEWTERRITPATACMGRNKRTTYMQKKCASASRKQRQCEQLTSCPAGRTHHICMARHCWALWTVLPQQCADSVLLPATPAFASPNT